MTAVHQLTVGTFQPSAHPTLSAAQKESRPQSQCCLFLMNIMMEVNDCHSHFICCTDVVLNLATFYNLRMNKNKSIHNTTSRHQDPEEHRRNIHTVIRWRRKKGLTISNGH